ncbi:MAG: GNAT family N-acetyltransferase [Thermoplasmata archaeon]|nr:GNAT family N-acetyltransferase [Thermoplasmata archaeon]
MPEQYDRSKFKYPPAIRSAMKMELRRLSHAEMQDRYIRFQYESPGHFRLEINENDDGWTVSLKKEMFPKTFRKLEQEKIITPYKGDSEIYGAFADGRELGIIQFEFQEYNGSVRVWDIDVAPEFRRKGVGKALMDLCKGRAAELGARRIVLETQTCNLNALAFYKAMGFSLAGLDVSHYTNDDLGKSEVRLEMAYYLGMPK